MRISDWSSDVCSSDLSYPLPVDPAGKALTRRAIDFALFPVVPHRTDSRFHEFLNDWRGEERQIANTVFPGSIHLVINGPLYRCTRALECPSGREGTCVGLRPARIAHKLHHATGILQEIALYDPADGRELGIKTQLRNVPAGKRQKSDV